MIKLVRKASSVALATASIVLASCSAQPAPAAPTSAPAAPTKAAAAAPAPTTAAAPVAAPATQAPAAPAVAAENLKIGIMTMLTGPQVRMGVDADRFLRMGIEDVNAKGGFKVGNKTYKFEATPTVDDKSTAEGGRDGANRLVLAEKVKFILGTVSTPAAGAQAVTEPNNVGLLTYTAVDKSLGTNFPLTVQIGTSHLLMRAFAVYDKLVQDQPKVKRLSAAYSDDPTGKAFAEAIGPYAKQKGLTIGNTEYYPLDAKDLTPLAVRLINQNPDAIDLGPASRAPQFSALTQALKEQNYKGVIFSASTDYAALLQRAPILDGFFTGMLTDFHSPNLSAYEQSVIDKFIAKYTESELEAFPIGNYNSPMLLAQAMTAAGSVDDATKVMKVLREGTWDTMYGKMPFVGTKTFGLPSVLQQPIYISEVKGGKLVQGKPMPGLLP